MGSLGRLSSVCFQSMNCGSILLLGVPPSHGNLVDRTSIGHLGRFTTCHRRVFTSGQIGGKEGC